MQQCPTCQLETQEGFEFCHHCGAPFQQTDVGVQQKSLGEALESLKQWGSEKAMTGSKVRNEIAEALGSPVSFQRQVLYALVVAFGIQCAAGSLPWSGELIPWLESWLLWALVLIVPISYWMTGVVPFSELYNQAIGDELSTRRRLFLSLVIVLFATIMPLVFSGETASSAHLNASNPIDQRLAEAAAWLLIAYYLMGFTAHWFAMQNLQYWLQLDDMADKADSIAGEILASVKNRDIRDLQVTEVQMSRLRNQTAGVSSGRRGRQITFTRGRSRIVVFVQDFGNSLFVRWRGYFETPGRRLWLLIGLFIMTVDQALIRWTGSSYWDLSTRFNKIISPVSRHQVLLTEQEGGYFARTFGLIRGVSEYAMNELFALERAVQSTVVDVLKTASSHKYREDEIKANIEQFIGYESSGSALQGARARA